MAMKSAERWHNDGVLKVEGKKKLFIANIIKKIAKNIQKLKKETPRDVLNRYKGSKGIFYHMTKGVGGEPKIGINPTRDTHNPRGIYAYDVNTDGVYRGVELNENLFMYIIKSKKPLFDLSSTNRDDYIPKFKILVEKYDYDYLHQYYRRSKGEVFFDITGRKIEPIPAQDLGRLLFNAIKNLSNGSSAKQTKIWMECGVESGLLDPGLGILDSEADPAQAVFFSTGAFTVIEVSSPRS